MSEQKIIELIKLADAALEKAAGLEEKLVSEQRHIDGIIPGVVKTLVDVGVVNEKHASSLAKALRSPVKTLKILTKVAEKINNSNNKRLGKLVDTLNGDNRKDFVIDRRVPIDESPAAKRFFDRIMSLRGY